MNYWWLIPFLAVFSYVLTGLLRRYALSRSLIDIPNQRSSHSIPTPRGGGVAIVLSFICALVILFNTGLISDRTAIALVGAGGIAAVIGFWMTTGI